MKKFLKWLFRPEFEDMKRGIEDDAFRFRFKQEDLMRRELIAQNALKQLGYEIVFNPKFVAKEYNPDAVPDIDGSALPNSLYLIRKYEQ